MRWCVLLLGACGAPPHADPADAPPATSDTASADAAGPIELFDGSSLAGWVGDPGVWQVVDGAIVASANITATTYLIYEPQMFGDFVLRGQVRIDTTGNSGLQYRSAVIDPVRWNVAGYQYDMGTNVWANLYEQRGRQLLARSGAACPQSVRPADWNDFEVSASGNHLEHRLNGQLCDEFTETDPTRPVSGVIALQYHNPGGYTVAFRALTVTEP